MRNDSVKSVIRDPFVENHRQDTARDDARIVVGTREMAIDCCEHFAGRILSYVKRAASAHGFESESRVFDA
jgi:hypothetical protein